MKEEEIPIVGLLWRDRPDKQETILPGEHIPTRRYDDEKVQKQVPVEPAQPPTNQQEDNKPVETEKHDITMQSLFDSEV